jgi:hypothetical protein
MQMLSLQPVVSARPLATCRPVLPAASRLGSGCESYEASLRRKLSISEDQMDAWAIFAATLWANHRRLADIGTGAQEPFGALENRLAALRSMRDAAAQLFAVLGSAQKTRAMQLLPLCCLP